VLHDIVSREFIGANEIDELFLKFDHLFGMAVAKLQKREYVHPTQRDALQTEDLQAVITL